MSVLPLEAEIDNNSHKFFPFFSHFGMNDLQISGQSLANPRLLVLLGEEGGNRSDWGHGVIHALWAVDNGRDDSPWYSSIQLFCQPIPIDWNTVIDRVAKELHLYN